MPQKVYSSLAGRDVEVDDERLRSKAHRPATVEERLARIEHELAARREMAAQPIELDFEVEYGWDSKPHRIVARERVKGKTP